MVGHMELEEEEAQGSSLSPVVTWAKKRKMILTMSSALVMTILVIAVLAGSHKDERDDLLQGGQPLDAGGQTTPELSPSRSTSPTESATTTALPEAPGSRNGTAKEGKSFDTLWTNPNVVKLLIKHSFMLTPLVHWYFIVHRNGPIMPKFKGHSPFCLSRSQIRHGCPGQRRAGIDLPG